MTRTLKYIYIRIRMTLFRWAAKSFMVMAMASCIFSLSIPSLQSKGAPNLWRSHNFSSSSTQLRKLSRLQAWELESGNAIVAGILAVDPWAPGSSLDSQSVASTLFAASLFPYLGFLYHLTKSGTAPKLTLFGFYFLLAFVGATIPAGIYAKIHYGTSLSNVDWLHGSAESLLTLTNLFIVFGLRKALRESKEGNQDIVSEDLID